MKIKIFVLCALGLCLSTANAQQRLSVLAMGNNFVKISGFGMSRMHETLEDTLEGMRTYRPGRPVFGNISMAFEVDTTPEMDGWINDLLSNKRQPTDFAVLLGSGRLATRKLSASGFPIKWSAPECRNTRGTSSATQCTLETELDTYNMDQGRYPIDSKVQKKWLPANFRLKIDGLDDACTRVNKIEAITVKQLAIGDLDGDGFPDDFAVSSSDLVFTLPAVDAEAFAQWFQDPGQRNASIDYMNDPQHGHRLSLQCAIHSVGLDMGDGYVTIRCSVTGKLVWSPKSN